MGVFEELGVKKIINCISTSSSCGSSVNFSPRWPEVLEAIGEASRNFVCINELQEKAGKVISNITGAEAAIVTPGCAAALTLAAAACMTKGTALEKYWPCVEPSAAYPPYPYEAWSADARNVMYQLPNTDGLKNEVIQQRCSTPRYHYTRCIGASGAKIVLAGTTSDCNAKDIEEQISDRTAAILFVGYTHKGAPIEKVMKISDRYDVPVIFDAAYTLPPKENLRRWVALGVELVCYSGGKSIAAPSDTGWLCGRKDLVKLAWLQMSPQHGIGRGFKVDKTQIVALVKSLQIYVQADERIIFDACEAKAKYLEDELKKLPHVAKVECFVPTEYVLQGWPVIGLTLNEQTLGIRTSEVVDRLYKGDPPIWTYYHSVYCPNGITMNTENLMDGEEKIVIERLRSTLTKA